MISLKPKTIRYREGFLVSGAMAYGEKKSNEKPHRARELSRLVKSAIELLKESMTDEEQRERAFVMSRRIWAARERHLERYRLGQDTSDLQEPAQNTVVSERARKMAQRAVGHSFPDLIQ